MKQVRPGLKILLGLFTLLLFPMGNGALAEDASQTTRAEKAKLAKEVKGIFERKCAKCHTTEGSQREKYKDEAGIDFILDLKRLAADPEIIIRGDPKGSGLFLQVEDGSMPYSDLGEEHLPQKEKEAIEKWIRIGAPDDKGDGPSFGKSSNRRP